MAKLFQQNEAKERMRKGKIGYFSLDIGACQKRGGKAEASSDEETDRTM